MMIIQVKRIYDAWETSDSYRILVDRLWPRGISKINAKLDEWAKNFTPSTKLRNEIHHQEIDWATFSSEYQLELSKNAEFAHWVETIKKNLETQNITLITAAKLEPISHVDTLKKTLEEYLKR